MRNTRRMKPAIGRNVGAIKAVFSGPARIQRLLTALHQQVAGEASFGFRANPLFEQIGKLAPEVGHLVEAGQFKRFESVLGGVAYEFQQSRRILHLPHLQFNSIEVEDSRRWAGAMRNQSESWYATIDN
jgi:hypothetical protein